MKGLFQQALLGVRLLDTISSTARTKLHTDMNASLPVVPLCGSITGCLVMMELEVPRDDRLGARKFTSLSHICSPFFIPISYLQRFTSPHTSGRGRRPHLFGIMIVTHDSPTLVRRSGEKDPAQITSKRCREQDPAPPAVREACPF